MKRLNGVHLKHLKNTAANETVSFPLPKLVKILMSQSMGAPCTPLVAVGDHVLVGQKIGDTDAFMSIPIHSSVSGTVLGIADHLLSNGNFVKAVVIESDGSQLKDVGLAPPIFSDRAGFIKAVRESGACGLGGAGFPTHIKLNFDHEKTPVDTLVINAAECEPYITSDYRELIEHPSDVYGGIKLLMEQLDIKSAKLCIENNKPTAIEIFTKMAAAGGEGIDVVTLPSQYPQGAEKMLVYSATGRIIRTGELPSNQGILVMNVSTTSFIYRYIKTGMPLISRRLTIDGSAIPKPCNVDVLVGTKIEDLLDFAGAKDYEKLLAGGPMMGSCIYDISAPVTKTYNALLALKKTKRPVPTACIRCGRCIKACPMDLMPTELEHAYDRRDKEALNALEVGLCMNCGCCSFVCPAYRALAEKNQLAKLLR